MAVQTQLRLVRSTKPELILTWVNGLPFKIECKGGIVNHGKSFALTFVLPEDYRRPFPMITDLK